VVLIAGGILLFANKAGVGFLPDWFFTWPVLIIAIRVVIGIQHNFRNFAWLMLTGWGVYALLNQQIPSLNLDRYTAPFFLVFIGMFFLLHRKKHSRSDRERWIELNRNINPDYTRQQAPPSGDPSQPMEGEFIDITSIFSGSKKLVLSKNFKGGDITSFMGGAELDLTQADIQGRAIIDATAIFGGIKIIVPSNWEIKMENTAAFGSVEDKRKVQNFTTDPSKLLVIQGTAIFGGIDITNY
jgi:predicted membrane protein